MAELQDKPRWNDIFVKRPVIAIVVSLLLLLAGIRSAVDIPVFAVSGDSKLIDPNYYTLPGGDRRVGPGLCY